ncbi:MAG: inorganic diphosphatase, partial [Chloroflexi bacterium]|nr:inorganic diphosphatase [Chloroflexota bacterium]
GFIPNSLSLDGDPLDVLIILHEPTFPGCHVMVRPIGVLRMLDEKGGDDKILAVPVADPRFNEVHELEDVGAHWLKEIENFFATYKTLQGLGTDIAGWRDRAEAWRIIEEALRAGEAAAHHG